MKPKAKKMSRLSTAVAEQNELNGQATSMAQPLKREGHFTSRKKNAIN